MNSNMKYYENICNCLRVIQQDINRKLKSANCWQQTASLTGCNAGCNDASQTSQYSEMAFHKGYLCRTANYFSKTDLNCFMSALLIEQMPFEDTW